VHLVGLNKLQVLVNQPERTPLSFAPAHNSVGFHDADNCPVQSFNFANQFNTTLTFYLFEAIAVLYLYSVLPVLTAKHRRPHWDLRV
jgi:hypothetical protein